MCVGVAVCVSLCLLMYVCCSTAASLVFSTAPCSYFDVGCHKLQQTEIHPDKKLTSLKQTILSLKTGWPQLEGHALGRLTPQSINLHLSARQPLLVYTIVWAQWVLRVWEMKG